MAKPKEELGAGPVLCRRPAEQPERLVVILLHAVAGAVQHTQIALGTGVTLLRSFTVAGHGFAHILFHAAAGFIAQAQTGQRAHVSGLCRSLEEKEGLVQIFACAVGVCTAHA